MSFDCKEFLDLCADLDSLDDAAALASFSRSRSYLQGSGVRFCDLADGSYAKKALEEKAQAAESHKQSEAECVDLVRERERISQKIEGIKNDLEIVNNERIGVNPRLAAAIKANAVLRAEVSESAAICSEHQRRIHGHPLRPLKLGLALLGGTLMGVVI